MRTEAEAHVRLRVKQDQEFRNRLISDPGAVILAETGVELSDEELAAVSEEIRQHISAAPGGFDGPLTEEELAQISGGFIWMAFEEAYS